MKCNQRLTASDLGILVGIIESPRTASSANVTSAIDHEVYF